MSRGRSAEPSATGCPTTLDLLLQVGPPQPRGLIRVEIARPMSDIDASRSPSIELIRAIACAHCSTLPAGTIHPFWPSCIMPETAPAKSEQRDGEAGRCCFVDDDAIWLECGTGERKQDTVRISSATCFGCWKPCIVTPGM